MYTVDYFIKKFEAIPEDKWCNMVLENSFGGHCALGHCGVTKPYASCCTYEYTLTEEGEALVRILNILSKTGSGPKFSVAFVANINDGCNNLYNQFTPKQRILAALYDIKKQQQPVYEDLTKTLAKLPVEETSDKIVPVKGNTVLMMDK